MWRTDPWEPTQGQADKWASPASKDWACLARAQAGSWWVPGRAGGFLRVAVSIRPENWACRDSQARVCFQPSGEKGACN